MHEVTHLTGLRPETTRRAELIAGIVAQTKRSTLDGLYTLLYHAEQAGNEVRSERIVQAIDIIDGLDQEATA